jgi:hypothetical protein
MIPFVSELARQFAQADNNDNANENQNCEHKKSECVLAGCSLTYSW